MPVSSDVDALDFWHEALIVHRDGRVIHANPAMLHGLGGRHIEDLRACPLSDILRPDQLVVTPLESPSPGGFGAWTAPQIVQVVTQDGSFRKLWAWTRPRPFMGEPALVTVLREIPPWGEDSRALSNVKDLIDVMDGGVVLISNSVFIHVNKAFARSLGYDDENDLRGRSLLDLLHPDDHEGTRDRARIHLERGEPSPPVEIRLLRRDGIYEWFEVTAYSMQIDGRPARLCICREISARRHSLTFLRAVIAASPIAIYTIDLNMQITEWNPAAERIFGWTRAEVMSLGWNPSLLDEERRVIPDVRRRLLEGEPLVEMDSQRIRKDGEIIDVSISVAALRDETGEPSGFVLMIADITGQKRAAAALRASNELVRAIVESSPIAIYSIDLNLQVTAWNPAAERLFGWKKEEVLGRRSGTVLPEEESLVPGRLQRLLKGEPLVNQPLSRLCKDGTVIPVQSSTAVMRDERGQPTGFVLFVVNITDQKRAEAALQESTDLVSAILESAPLAIMAFDTSGQVRMWNRSAARIFGWQAHEVVGRALIKEIEALPQLRDAPQRLLRGEQILGAELTWEQRDGESLDLVVSGAPLRDEAGRLTGIVATAVDVTERNRERAQARELEEALRRSETMSALGALVAGVAHDVRNPLFSMTAAVDAMESRWKGDAGLQPFLKVLRSEAVRLNNLMTDLLEYGKPPAPLFEEGSLSPILAEAARICRQSAADAGVRIEIEGDPHPARIRMAPERLTRVFQNLIQNAIQYSPRGNRVRIATRLQEIRGRHFVETSILDSGPGFAEKDLKHVLEPFYSRRPGGVGLGLSIAQRILEQHGGTIIPGNAAEGGAQVVIRIPTEDHVIRH